MNSEKVMSPESAIDLYILFEEQGIDIWLDGGWGIDALLGKQTRTHGDIDIVVEERNIPQLRKLIEEKGYNDVTRDDTRDWNFVLADDNGNELDVHVIVFDDNGNGIYGPAENGDMYPSYAFTGTGEINGHEVKCLSPEYQIESHSGYQLRDSDHHDVRAICEKFDIPLPEEYKK